MARPGAACPPPARRVMVAARALLFWALVYSYCGLCACIAGLRLLWSIGRRPGETFRRVVRENPPACLNDPSLGTHCYVRIDQGEGEGGGGGSGPRGAHTRPCRAGQPCPPSGARVCTGSVRAPLRTPARPRAPAPLPLPLPPGSGAGLAGARRGAAQAGPGPAARGGSGARRAGGRGAGRLGGREGRRATPGVSQPACELRAPSRPAPPLFTACLVAGGSACRASGWRGERSAQGEAPSPRWCD